MTHTGKMMCDVSIILTLTSAHHGTKEGGGSDEVGLCVVVAAA